MKIQNCLLILSLVMVFAVSGIAQTPNLGNHFDYDKNAPLDVKTVGFEKRGNVTIYDITYASPKGGVVPAYLVVPQGKGPFAAVIWGHWYQRGSEFLNRKEFLDEALVLAGAGVISLLPDGPIARPGYVADNTPLNEKQVADLVQAVVDMRRGIDLLLARKDVDQKRLAYVGHSYHASMGAFLSGIDRRPKAYVLMAGPLSDEIDFKTPTYEEFRQKVGPEKFDAFAAKYSWSDQGKYIKHAAPAFVFMQFATKERFLTPEHVRKYETVVSDPKMLKIYDAPHALNAEATRDRIEFLTKQLKLKKLSPSVIAAIPELQQPPAQP